MDIEKIGGRIKIYRDSLGLNMREFSDKTGVSRARLSDIERGASFGLDILSRILTAYPELNLIWVMTGQGGMLDAIEGEVIEAQDTQWVSYELPAMHKKIGHLMEDLNEREREKCFTDTQELLQERLWRESMEERMKRVEEMLQKLVDTAQRH